MNINHHKVYDSHFTPLEHFRHNGYYTVGEHVFNHKLNALEFASRSNLPVNWEFNTDVFRSMAWRTPPDIGLDEVYRIRAQQLRDKYNYLVLAFSGGSDSSNILDTFLKNQIPIDEIVTEWPNKLIPEKAPINLSTEPKNYIYEWHRRIGPALKYLSQNYPKIKITKLDLSDLMGIEDFEDTCTIINHHAMAAVKRWRFVDNRLKDISSTHQNVGLILGTDKPRIHIERQIFCVFFADSHCWNKSSVGDFQKNVEYFYWTPDLPDIIKVQAHKIYNYLCDNPYHIYFFDSSQIPDRYTRYQDYKIYCRLHADLIKKIVYPTWDVSIFQADKGDSLIHNDQYSSLMIEKNSVEFQSWNSNLNSRMSMIDKKYIEVENLNNGKKIFKNYKNFYSRLYPIGKLPIETISCHIPNDNWSYI